MPTFDWRDKYIGVLERAKASMAGYRRELNDFQPCDSEQEVTAMIESLKEEQEAVRQISKLMSGAKQ